MRVEHLTKEQMDRAYADIENDLEAYRAGGPFAFEGVIDTGLFAQDFEFDLAPDSIKLDAVNAETIYRAFRHLPASLLRDGRFWTHLSLTRYLPYTSARWPLDADRKDAITRVRDRYFCKSERGLDSRHALSGLYWTGHLAARHSGDLSDNLAVITHTAEVRAQFMERPGVFAIPSVTSAAINRFSRSLKEDGGQLLQRSRFREIMANLNLACGSTAVECLPSESVQRLVDEAIKATLEVEAPTAESAA